MHNQFHSKWPATLKIPLDMRLKLFIVWLALMFSGSAAALDNKAGNTPNTASENLVGTHFFSKNKYVEYIVGDLPIVLSAPHGGKKTSSAIPNRRYGTTVTDTNTDKVIMEIASAFHQRIGRSPHVVICHLKRTALDCNRPIKEAAQGNADAEEAWHSFHAYIDQAKSEISKTWSHGFYVDIHAHGHLAPLVELGYLIRDKGLQGPIPELNSLASKSSIRNLQERSTYSLSELLRGEYSFGALLTAHGIKAIPSPAYPDARGRPYFNGGYNTWRHGSRRGGEFNGFQVEIPYSAILRRKSSRKRFANAFVESMLQYLQHHEGWTFEPPSNDVQ